MAGRIADLVVKNARTMLDGRESVVGIAIHGARIVAIAAPAALPLAAGTVIDADGRWVIPGAIDTHAHVGQTAPEYEHREGFDMASNFAWDTRSALAGGVTTALNYVRFGQASLLEAYRSERAIAAENSRINVLFHGYVMNQRQMREIRAGAREGLRTFKLFMPYRGQEAKDLGGIGSLNHAELRLAFREIAAVGAQALVHAEDGDIVEHCTAAAREVGESLADWEASRPTVAEGDASYSAIYLAGKEGCPVTIVHVSSIEGVRARRALGRGSAALESCPHYLLLSTESGIGPQGKVAPPLRRPSERDPLLEAVLAGDIDFFGSDHNVWPAEAKRDMWSGRAGLPGIGLLLPLLATELVANRGLGFERLVELTSTGAARRFGLYPAKGTIQVGSDADLVVLDEGTRRVSAADLASAVDYSPYEGISLRYWPWSTIRGGAVVYQEGEFPSDDLRGDILNEAPSS
ncbi:MAG TPA: amidohydrolase family protein [Actinomycetes bacterium]|jgi:dihydroorotase-like cyclic amidohydrolase|nr:amidohydrolase family protein [Actinomycetes bacterium]